MKICALAVMIAIAQILLAAPALGLGNTYTGSIKTVAWGYHVGVGFLGIPKDLHRLEFSL